MCLCYVYVTFVKFLKLDVVLQQNLRSNRCKCFVNILCTRQNNTKSLPNHDDKHFYIDVVIAHPVLLNPLETLKLGPEQSAHPVKGNDFTLFR